MSLLPFSFQRLLGPVTQGVDPQRQSLISRLLAALLKSTELPGRDDFARLRPALRWAIVGLASCIGLTIIIAVAAIVSVGMSTSTFQMFSLRASAASSAEARAQHSFESILQRPLFSRNRQAATAVALAPALPVATRSRNFILKGVFINGASSKAFLISEQSPLGIWIESNDEIAGWHLVTVKPDQVVLRAQSDELVIALGNVSGSGNFAEIPSLPHGSLEASADRLNRRILVNPNSLARGTQNTKPTAPGLQGGAR
jgi:hypothetical protein